MSSNIEALRKRVEQYMQEEKLVYDHVGVHVAYGDLWAFHIYKPSLQKTCSGVPIFVLLNEDTAPRLCKAEEIGTLIELAWP